MRRFRRASSIATLGLVAMAPAAAAQCLLQKLVPSAAHRLAEAGQSVDVDEGVILVGSAGEPEPGFVCVYERGEGNWVEAATLVAPEVQAGDRFGATVSISRGTVFAGAAFRDSVADRSGSVFVFVRDEERRGWRLLTELTASDAAAGDLFGHAVAIDGATAVIGAPTDDDACPGDPFCNSGAAYVFARDADGAWFEVAKLTGRDTERRDNFGYAVAIHGDALVVGAWLDDDLGSSSGAAYVFERDAGGDGVWAEVAKLTAADGDAFDRLGRSVDIDGSTVIVGAVHDEEGDQPAAGSAYVFERDVPGPRMWGEVARLTASNAAAGDWFGGAVAIETFTVVIGAQWNGGIGVNTGSAYVFTQQQAVNDWAPFARLSSTDAATFRYGSAVAMAGGVAVVGAPWDEDAGLRAGAVYVYDIPSCDSCRSDVNADGAVDVDDLIGVIGRWGPCDARCVADIDESGVVDVDDLLTVVLAWGAACH